MKIVTVVGARPQFIKEAAVSRSLRKHCTEVIIHTGQHYDKNMSDIFQEELEIPVPDYNLGIGSGTHGQQTAGMLFGIEKILLEEKPDSLLVYGDTNSTIAGALAASKLLIPVIHVEAGLRSFNLAMPEEQNRIVTDHLSTILFCPTETAVRNLKNEGIQNGVHCVGDVMFDSVKYYTDKLSGEEPEKIFQRLNGWAGSVPALDQWYLATIHRAENTDDIRKIREILSAFQELEYPVIFPVHPRTEKLVKPLLTEINVSNIFFVEPIGYLEMLYFTKYACKIITDSGGIQKEGYFLGTPCVTVRDQTEWVETLEGNFNILAKPDKEDILKKTAMRPGRECRKDLFGDGHASKKICEILFNGRNRIEPGETNRG